MAIQIQGNGGVITEVDGTTFRALRTVSKPLDHGSLGHYRLSTTIALTAAQAANGTLFSFRWGDATRFCVPSFIRLELIQTAAQTATIMPSFQMFIARSFSVSDSIGTALSLTGNAFKKRANMGTTLVSDIRKSTAAAGLTVGTRTLDLDPMMEMGSVQTITTANNTTYIKSMDLTNSGIHPLVLSQNEGIIIKGPTVAFGAAGTANLIIGIEWAEVSQY